MALTLLAGAVSAQEFKDRQARVVEQAREVDILERLRLVKSEHEIPFVRRASAVGNVWMRTMMEAIEPGRTEGRSWGRGCGSWPPPAAFRT
jgi:Xaa-Pro aminopeptidase